MFNIIAMIKLRIMISCLHVLDLVTMTMIIIISIIIFVQSLSLLCRYLPNIVGNFVLPLRVLLTAELFFSFSPSSTSHCEQKNPNYK